MEEMLLLLICFVFFFFYQQNKTTGKIKEGKRQCMKLTRQRNTVLVQFKLFDADPPMIKDGRNLKSRAVCNENILLGFGLFVCLFGNGFFYILYFCLVFFLLLSKKATEFFKNFRFNTKIYEGKNFTARNFFKLTFKTPQQQCSQIITLARISSFFSRKLFGNT